jgi:hypothetical protein
MIPVVSRTATISIQIYEILGRLMRLVLSLSFFGFTSSISPLFLCLIMRMRLFVILTAGAAEEEQNFLGIARTHTASVRKTSVTVKSETIALHA